MLVSFLKHETLISSFLCSSYRFQVDGKDVKIDIFDLAGQPYFYEVIGALPVICTEYTVRMRMFVTTT